LAILSLARGGRQIDYREEAFDEVLDNLDFVFDTVVPDIALRSIKVLKPGGTLLSIALMGADGLVYRRHLPYTPQPPPCHGPPWRFPASQKDAHDRFCGPPSWRDLLAHRPG
jgi:hypothetical protein